MRVYVDASVIIAALLSSKGGSSLLIEFIRSGAITGITSQTVVEEMLEADKQTKLKRSKEEIEAFIAHSGLLVRESIVPEDIEPLMGMIDTDDAHLIAGAQSTQCSYLVTLDKKHLLRSDIKEKFLPLRIVSPKEMLEQVLGAWRKS